jgi:hypothetical protein
MKKITEGEMPIDFWNYNVNPILGYYIEKEDYQTKAMERKYNKLSQSI